jgi:hypothetical protein
MAMVEKSEQDKVAIERNNALVYDEIRKIKFRIVTEEKELEKLKKELGTLQSKVIHP